MPGFQPSNSRVITYHRVPFHSTLCFYRNAFQALIPDRLSGIGVNEEAPHFVRSDFVPGVIEKSPTKNAGGGSVFCGALLSPSYARRLERSETRPTEPRGFGVRAGTSRML